MPPLTAYKRKAADGLPTARNSGTDAFHLRLICSIMAFLLYVVKGIARSVASGG